MRKKVGLALGGGGARGCAHVGVIRALQEADIPIDYVAGTSTGSLFGGIFVAGGLDKLEDFFNKIRKIDVIRQFDPALLKNGMFKGNRLIKFLDTFLVKKTFEEGEVPFLAVATDLETGKEIEIKSGKLAEAIRASLSLPVLFMIYKHGDRHLIDGSLVNPLPIKNVRDMGADIVIAIDVNREYVSDRWKEPARKRMTFMDSFSSMIYISQNAVSQLNMKEQPADILLTPKLKDTGLLDFHMGRMLMEEGYKQMKKKIPEIKRFLKQ